MVLQPISLQKCVSRIILVLSGKWGLLGCSGLWKNIQHYLWYASVKNKSKMNRSDYSGLNYGQIMALRGMGEMEE